MFLPEFKHIFASLTQILLTKHMLSSLATMKAMLTSLQCCWSERTTITDREVEAEGPQAGHRKGMGKKERNLEGPGDIVAYYLVRGQRLFVGCKDKIETKGKSGLTVHRSMVSQG